MSDDHKIRVAIVGVGNCALSLLQGVMNYRHHPNAEGVITRRIGRWAAGDIEPVAAFDVVVGKVGRPLATAARAYPNCATQLYDIRDEWPDVHVSRGPTLDGLGSSLRAVTGVTESDAPVADVAQVLADSGAQVVVNYLPVGSEEAARVYARAAIEAGCAFVNCMPVFLASDPAWAAMFERAGLPIIGDDVKSQVGATIAHRVLARLMDVRGVRLLRTYQLNVGGNSDFANMLERSRLISKKISKTQAVTSVAGRQLPARDVHVGPSDHVPWLYDRKVAFIRLEGEGWGGAPMNMELRMEVHDSPNSAGVVADAVRWAMVGLESGHAGVMRDQSGWLMKSPPVQSDDFWLAETLEQEARR